jgi:hypothetical protein
VNNCIERKWSNESATLEGDEEYDEEEDTQSDVPPSVSSRQQPEDTTSARLADTLAQSGNSRYVGTYTLGANVVYAREPGSK